MSIPEPYLTKEQVKSFNAWLLNQCNPQFGAMKESEILPLAEILQFHPIPQDGDMAPADVAYG